ncbi:unnamed protein product [Chondrus crispus]|uniref:Uncharacterized protein n=1 Tax=Chondrus crispus TaxID=2769 RepID=R7Q5D4_CHOCR|nr:unnamed protein product [Chondrus crispus]CDF32670.1 unnamed protein product [Chondrus crispus]|eukprot:XP_005712441.1 unnamed protein product [Chondrus crispus]
MRLAREGFAFRRQRGATLELLTVSQERVKLNGTETILRLDQARVTPELECPSPRADMKSAARERQELLELEASVKIRHCTEAEENSSPRAVFPAHSMPLHISVPLLFTCKLQENNSGARSRRVVEVVSIT